ncbi:MAG: peptidylprolyl isomerase [Firmicutes bacterium]|nr:peptidylprolyl isomerase [Bacillota bacterium]
MKKILILLLSLMLIFTFMTACGGDQTTEQEDPGDAPASDGELVAPRIVKMTIKDYGTITLELDPNEAPETVRNFCDLAASGFYDGLKFHRIMDGFMIQGGGNEEVELEPIVGEFASNGYNNTISHKEGVISMARFPNDPNSATSQFFITVADDSFLDGDYAAFGYVTEGLDICKQIAADSNPIDDNGTIPEEEQPIIESVEVVD